jgi:hypothetical protein
VGVGQGPTEVFAINLGPLAIVHVREPIDNAAIEQFLAGGPQLLDRP